MSRRGVSCRPAATLLTPVEGLVLDLLGGGGVVRQETFLLARVLPFWVPFRVPC